MAYVCIPSALRKWTNEKELLQIHGKTVKEVIFNLLEIHSALKPYLLNDSKQRSSFVNIYLNSRYVHSVLNCEEELTDIDELIIVPAFAGG